MLRDQRFEFTQLRGEGLGLARVRNRHALDEWSKETFLREQALADIEQTIAAAGAGDGLDFAEKDGKRVDIPALRAQALAALAQGFQALGQVAQEREPQLRRLLGVVLLLHWLRPDRWHYTSAGLGPSRRLEVCASTA